MVVKKCVSLNILIGLVFCVVSCFMCVETAKNGTFSSVVKHVMRNVTATPENSNAHGIPLNNSDHFRIIGGVETARNEFPFIVSFSRNGRHFCGGAIIDKEWVLSASHCASEPDFDVTAGEHNLELDEGTEQKSRAILVIRNANYNPITYEDDICLIKVSPPFNYDQYTQEFSVPSTHYVAAGSVTVAGWGTEDEAFQVVSPVLRKVTVPLVPSLECSKQYGSYFHPLKMMCAGEEEGGKDACQGDSGGPLMCDDYDKGATLCGVVSFGLGCARPELAGVYTKVAYYSDWIEYQIRINTGKELPPVSKHTTLPPTRPTRRTTTIDPNQEFKPGNATTIVRPPYTHRNKTRGRSASSNLSPNTLHFITLFASLLFLFNSNRR